MIVIDVDLHLQVLICKVCKEQLEIKRPVLQDQHALLELRQATERDHRECARSNGNAEKAMRDRAFRKRVERELRKTQKPQRNALPRCSNRRQRWLLGG